MKLPFATLSATLLGVLMFNPALPAQKLSADGGAQTFQLLADQYFTDVAFKFSPTSGTQAGFHQYDTELEDYSAATIAKQVAALHTYEGKISAVPPASLDASVAADRDILLNSIHSQLLSLETIRNWEKNPDIYSSGITNAVFVLMERPFAPVNVRLRSAVAREQRMPPVFDEARKNLKNPPHIYTEIALEQIDGIISFFQNDVPAAFKNATDPQAKADFAQSNAAVVASLKQYSAWLKSDLLPRSTGDFRLGADTFRKKLAYDEMVDVPLPHLLEIAYADLHRNQAEFARIAKEVDPTKTPTEVLAELAMVHPSPNQLLGAFQAQFSGLIAYINTNHIITIPSKVEPTLEETPPFMRATTQASMDPPGPFETHSTKAYFNVTLPEKDWTPAHVAEHMAAFNVGTITSTAVHEAYPGHYVQFLWQDQFPSRVRKLVGANTNIEGWAHYCEQMMLDEGYLPAGVTAGSREAKLLRLGQLQDALLRDARFVVSIRLHTNTAPPASETTSAAKSTSADARSTFTFDQAVDFFVREGYQSHAIGLIETKRGTSDATYLYYTLGKLQILKLRADVKARQGGAFNLQQFHDSFMREGPAPIKVIRKDMLHNDSPVL